MAKPSSPDTVIPNHQQNKGMLVSPLAAILAVPAEWGRGPAIPEGPHPAPEEMEVMRSLLRAPTTSYYSPGTPDRAAQPNSRGPPGPLPHQPLDAPSDGLSVIKAQRVASLLVENPREPAAPREPTPTRERSWNKHIAINADNFGQEVVREIDELKVVMDEAIENQPNRTRHSPYLDEELDLLYILRHLDIPYTQIAEDYLTRRTPSSLAVRIWRDCLKRR